MGAGAIRSTPALIMEDCVLLARYASASGCNLGIKNLPASSNSASLQLLRPDAFLKAPCMVTTLHRS